MCGLLIDVGSTMVGKQKWLLNVWITRGRGRRQTELQTVTNSVVQQRGVLRSRKLGVAMMAACIVTRLVEA